jgi:hypothetical protein
MVHAYLMYGYPTQTVQETIDSLEMVRQLFELGIIQSGFWHQFAMTAHSPVGMFPEEFGVIPIGLDEKALPLGGLGGLFANNDIQFKDKTGINHDKFSFGLKKSLFNFMHGICFDFELQDWFDFKIPNTTIPSDYIVSCLEKEDNFNTKPSAKIIWIGGKPITDSYTKSKKGNSWEMTKLIFHDKKDTIEFSLEKDIADWLLNQLELCSVPNDKQFTFKNLKDNFETKFADFELFWYSKPIHTLKEIGLLVL